MRRWIVGALLLVAVLALVLLGRLGQRDGAAQTAEPRRPWEETSAVPPERARPAPQEPRGARAQRDALREQIVRALQARPAAPAPSAELDQSAAPAPSAATAPPPAHPPGNLRDRIGGRDALVRSLNQDFMPLAHECIERAQERSPALKGMLALSIETLSDEQLGAVVDVAEAAPSSEVSDPALLECIRETAYSLRLPPPPSKGREKFMLTLPIEPPDAGAP